MEEELYPETAKIVMENTYMDDIIDSVSDKREALSKTRDIERLIGKGGFKIKGWILSGGHVSKDGMLVPIGENAATEKVLGVSWNPVEDNFCFRVKLNFSERKKKLRTEPDIKLHQLQEKIPQFLTKRMILSQVNSIYDPPGLAGPFTVRAKIMMRQLWAREVKFDWNDPLPEEYKRDWVKFFSDLFGMNSIKFERCLKPPNAVGDPSICAALNLYKC